MDFEIDREFELLLTYSDLLWTEKLSLERSLLLMTEGEQSMFPLSIFLSSESKPYVAKWESIFVVSGTCS